MHTMTEEFMRRKLDGTFVRILVDGTLKRVKVHQDFMPTHERRHLPRCSVEARGGRVPFSKEEDCEIAELTKRGKSRTHIAIAVGRKYASVSSRQDYLRERGLI